MGKRNKHSIAYIRPYWLDSITFLKVGYFGLWVPRNFIYFAVQNKNNCLRLLLRTSDDNLIDEKKLTKKIPKTHGYGNITRQLYLSPKDEKSEKFSIEDIMGLINQSYDSTQ